MDFKKSTAEKNRWGLRMNDASCFEQTLEAALHKAVVIR